MKGVVFTGDRQIALMDFPDPTPGPGEVVLEIRASGMCGSDLKFYRAAGGPGRTAALGLGASSGPTIAVRRRREGGLWRDRPWWPCALHGVPGTHAG